MKPAAFTYAKARSLEEAIALLGEAPGEARLLAGGQSLMPALNMRLDAPALVIDINGIGLDAIQRKNGFIEIGALARHVAAERSALIAEAAPFIAKAPHDAEHFRQASWLGRASGARRHQGRGRFVRHQSACLRRRDGDGGAVQALEAPDQVRRGSTRELRHRHPRPRSPREGQDRRQARRQDHRLGDR